MLIVLDTNVWLKERMLRSATGVALLYATKRIGAKLLVPTSTRREIVTSVARAGASAVDNVERGLGIVQSLLGTRPGLELPCDADFRAGAESRLDELAELIESVEVGCEHLEKALDRAIDHRPPARTSDELRDCILWQCLLDLDEECYFVTADGDFLDQKAKGTVLAPELVEESGGKVTLLATVADLLAVIEPQLPQVNLERITDAIAAVAEPELVRASEAQNWTAGNLSGSSIELYATERPNTITVVFELAFRVFDGEDLQGVHVDEGVARVAGESLFSDESGVTEVLFDRIDLFTYGGERIKGGIAYINGAVISLGGPLPVPYKVRTRLPGSPA